MALDRARADGQQVGDLLVLCDSATSFADLLLARRERRARPEVVRVVEVGAHDRADRRRVQERLAAHRRAAGLDQVAVGHRLEHVAARARLQGLEAVRLDVVHGEHQHAQRRSRRRRADRPVPVDSARRPRRPAPSTRSRSRCTATDGTLVPARRGRRRVADRSAVEYAGHVLRRHRRRGRGGAPARRAQRRRPAARAGRRAPLRGAIDGATVRSVPFAVAVRDERPDVSREQPAPSVRRAAGAHCPPPAIVISAFHSAQPRPRDQVASSRAERAPGTPRGRRVEERPRDHHVAGGVADAGGAEVDHRGEPPVAHEQVVLGHVAVEPHRRRRPTSPRPPRPTGARRAAVDLAAERRDRLQRLVLVVGERAAAVEVVRAGPGPPPAASARAQRGEEAGEVGRERGQVRRPRRVPAGSPSSQR